MRPGRPTRCTPTASRLLLRSIDFARDIGADLVNLHLYMDDGAAGYVRSLEPVIRHAAEAGLRLSIENTPHTTPDDFNQTFACLREIERPGPGRSACAWTSATPTSVRVTHNNFIRYLDALAPEVPLIHLHVHENYGDADSHLTLFTGPARDERLRREGFSGAAAPARLPRRHDPGTVAQSAGTAGRGRDRRLRELLTCQGDRQQSLSPLPCTRGRGVGGEGENVSATIRLPRPRPPPPSYRRRRGKACLPLAQAEDVSLVSVPSLSRD